MLTVTFSHLFQPYGDSSSQEKGTVSHESLALGLKGAYFSFVWVWATIDVLCKVSPSQLPGPQGEYITI